jgi:lipopolysaccharide transport system ATP-binding protein
MSYAAISVEKLSKAYRIGLKETMPDTAIGAVTSWIKTPWRNYRRIRRLNTFGNETSNCIAPTPGESAFGTSGDGDRKCNFDDIFWALQDVSFTVKAGEAVGIIGRNGAGKSTLLKILSRIVEPTAGKAIIRGRISSLLEVGTGFHPDLTGRENVYLNGTILGMTKREIDRKFDEIVDFSGVERFLDTPVKRYSSGMQVRLAFAVAAHLEPEILVIDEVLAVGDAAFQSKCLGKMESVVRQGRTILFVSHNMAAISALVTRCILLDAGRVWMDGPVGECVAEYIGLSYKDKADWEASELNNKPMQITRVRVSSEGSERAIYDGNEFDVAKGVRVDIEYVVRQTIRNAVVAVNIHAHDGAHLISLEDVDHNPDLLLRREPGAYCASVVLPGNWLNSGTYLLRSDCGMIRGEEWDRVERIKFQLVETGDHLTRQHRRCYLLPKLKWEMRALDASPV